MKIKPFWKVYIIFSAALITVIIALLIIAWNALADYEKTLPEVSVQTLISDITAESYDLFCENLNIVKAGFIKNEEIKNRLVDIIGSNTLTFTKAYSRDRIKNPAFTLMAGKAEVAKVYLKLTGEKSFFGHPLYEIDFISEFHGEKEPATITVPESYKVSINGKTLDNSWVYSIQASNFDIDFSLDKKAKKPKTKTFKIDGFLAHEDIQIQNSDGEKEEASFNDGIIEIDYKTLKIAAPEGCNPIVNKVDIKSGDWILDEAFTDEMIARIPQKYLSDCTDFKMYKVTGFAESPKITLPPNQKDNYIVELKETEEGYFARISQKTANSSEFEKIALEFGKLYAQTVSNDYSKPAFLTKILPDSPIKSEISGALRPEFYSAHTGNYFENTKTSNLFVYSDSAFTCDVNLTHCISGVRISPDKALKFDSAMRMCFIRQNDTWFLAEWMLIT